MERVSKITLWFLVLLFAGASLLRAQEQTLEITRPRIAVAPNGGYAIAWEALRQLKTGG